MSKVEPEPLSGLLWKQSPSRFLFGMHQRRLVRLEGGRLSWALPEKGEDSDRPTEKGFVDFRVNTCLVEPVPESDMRFLLRPVGSWALHGAGGRSFTGSEDSSTRVFSFDVSGSDHSRDEWLEALKSHILYGQKMAEQPSAKKKKKKKAGVAFVDATPEALDAATEATGGPKRDVRSRVNTGFAREADVPPPEKSERRGPQFNDEPEELEAATEASGGPKRDVRSRVNTGFAKASDVPKEERRGLQFDDKAEQLDAASEAVAGPKRDARTRVNTGFAREEDAPKERKALQFSDKAEQLDAASGATEGPKRDVRTRVNTGFAREEDAPKEKSERKPLKFNDTAEQLDAASEAAGGPKRDVRARVNTGFAKEEDVKRHAKADGSADERRPPRFQDGAEELEAASSACDGPHRNIRTRINTGFAAKDGSGSSDAKDAPTDGMRKQSSLQFGDYEELEAATEATTGGARSVRARVNTGFISDNHFSDSDDSDTGSVGPMRQTALMRRLSSKRFTRQSSRLSIDKAALSAAAERRKMQHSAIGSGFTQQNADSPEASIHEHELQDMEKDIPLLKESLKPLTLFENLGEEQLEELVEAMLVFGFKDGEEVVRQADTGGTHFFVIAQGVFEVVKDGIIVNELTKGVTFGESVLLIDGQRAATVRAKGDAIVYGMEADDVREVLHFQYEAAHKEVMTCVDKIVESEACDQFDKLNAFQLHKIYTDSAVRTFESGESIIREGEKGLDHVFVLVQGSVLQRCAGKDLGRIHRFKMFGERDLLFGESSRSCVADGVAKTLVMSRSILSEVFGELNLATALLRSSVYQRLYEVEACQKLYDDQRQALSRSFELRSAAGKAFDTTGIRFVLCLHGDVEVSSDGFKKDVRPINDHVGAENLLQPDLKWNLSLRAKTGTAFVAVWDGDEVRSILARDDAKEKLRVLKTVFLFRTLAEKSLRSLAASMATRELSADEAVFKQGDMGDAFYIVGTGRLSIEKSGRFIRTLGQGDYFGERALLTHEPRSASILASEQCTIWEITRDVFSQVMSDKVIEHLKGRFALQDAEYTFHDLTFVRTIGTGGFASVKMVKTKVGERFALKCIEKKPLVEHRQQDTVVNERSILAGIDHPFIVRLVQSFRSEAYIYLLMELVSGGELLEALTTLGILSDTQAQFYLASIILAFEHLHDRRIAYLDLKSENILIDHQGFIKLVDFGLAVKISGAQSHAVRGTPHFMAPEMILGKGYDTTADLWSLGICAYEFMVGNLPFGNGSSSRSEIFNAVLKAPLVFPAAFRENAFAKEAMSFMAGLLNRDPTRRLGGGMEGYRPLVKHPFLQLFDWDGLVGRVLVPPYVPKKEHYSTQKKDEQAKNLAVVEKHANEEVLRSGWKDPQPGWDDDFA